MQVAAHITTLTLTSPHEFGLDFPKGVLGQFFGADVPQGADELTILARLVPHGLRDAPDMFDLAVGHPQARLEIEGRLSSHGLLERPDHEIAVLGMNPLHREIEIRLGRHIEAENPKSLLGPHQLRSGGLPSEAACIAELLRTSKIRFAPVEF